MHMPYVITNQIMEGIKLETGVRICWFVVVGCGMLVAGW
jgi:hypothetical protein